MCELGARSTKFAELGDVHGFITCTKCHLVVLVIGGRHNPADSRCRPTIVNGHQGTALRKCWLVLHLFALPFALLFAFLFADLGTGFIVDGDRAHALGDLSGEL